MSPKNPLPTSYATLKNEYWGHILGLLAVFEKVDTQAHAALANKFASQASTMGISAEQAYTDYYEMLARAILD